MQIVKQLIYNKIKFPDKAAICSIDNKTNKTVNKRLTWSDLYTEVCNYAIEINHICEMNKSKIALYSSNSIEFVTTFYASLMTNHPLFLVNKKLTDEYVCEILKFTHTEVLFYDEISTQLKNLIKKNISNLKLISLKTKKFTINNNHTLKNPENKKEVKIKGSDIALLICTSGSTGKPKIAQHTYKSISTIAQDTKNTVQKNNTSFLSTFPYFHIGGLYSVWASLYSSDELFILEGKTNAKRIISTINKYKISYLSIPVPTVNDMINMYKKNKNKKKLHSNILFTSGAQNVNQQFLTDWIKYFSYCKHLQVYGNTEAGFLLYGYIKHNKNIKEINYKYTYTSQVKIDNNGELLIKGDTVFKGYYNNKQQTNKIIKNGWLHTGDLAKINKDKSISIVGRIKDIIISGGENINPIDIENYILKKFDIDDVVVLGIPDNKFGEQVAALINPGKCKYSEEQIINKCKNLPIHMQPKSIKFANNFREHNKKINKLELYNNYFK